MKVLKTEKYDFPPYPGVLLRTAKQETRKCIAVGICTYEENGQFCVDYVDATPTKKGVEIVSISKIEIDGYEKMFQAAFKE